MLVRQQDGLDLVLVAVAVEAVAAAVRLPEVPAGPGLPRLPGPASAG